MADERGGLDAYRQKRDFASTPEPHGEQLGETGELRFVIQKHAARRLHYDFRLEHQGVLLSWAIPKGPSLDPRTRRLAIQTEDHPIAYADFEGTIPAGQYGAGRVLIWDRGTWIPEGDPSRDYEAGRLHFRLDGEKLHGRWNLVRLDDRRNWLLIKSRDEFARSDATEIVDAQPRSVVSGRSIDAIAESDPPASATITVAPVELPSIAPQLAKLVARPPAGDDWLHEIKLDGYRVLADIRGVEARLRTRGGEDWTARLPELAAALATPTLANCVLDGELCAFDREGRSRFARLQRALAAGETSKLIYSVFDLPFAAGQDARDRPLLERKQALALLLERAGLGDRVRFCSHIVGSGAAVFERACALGTEGIISKRVDARYESRRTRTWLKCKCPRRLTVLVGGFTPPKGSRKHFGALLVGTKDAEGRLRYRGKVGAGFAEATLAELSAQLEPLRRVDPAFVDPPTGPEAGRATWTDPELAIDVEYAELTDQGRLREPRFVGVHELAHAPARVRLTHPDKLMYPEFSPAPLRKRDVADYVMQVAEWMLPQVRERPLTLVRCPDGVGGGCFYQRHAMPGLPTSVRRTSVHERDGHEVVYASVVDALGLVGLVQMSVVELHPWAARVGRLDQPDRLIFDLDPDLELEFMRVVEAAIEVRDRLLELGLRSFVKSTGGKGLHVVAPIAPRLEFGPIKQLCRALARRMVEDSPSRYTAIASKAERRGKLFIDYLRNGRGATSVAPYSLRAKPHAPVSTPLSWAELGPGLDPASFDARSVPARLAELDHDPWAGFFELDQSVCDATLRAFGVAPEPE